MLLADTVGFIRKLPHALVAAFRATLEGIEEARLIVHVVDASHAAGSELIRAVDAVLAEIGVLDRPRLLVWNKCDLPAGGPPPVRPPGGTPEEVRISAKTGDGLAALLAKIDAMVGTPYAAVEALVPYESYELVRLAYEHGAVHAREDTHRRREDPRGGPRRSRGTSAGVPGAASRNGAPGDRGTETRYGEENRRRVEGWREKGNREEACRETARHEATRDPEEGGPEEGGPEKAAGVTRLTGPPVRAVATGASAPRPRTRAPVQRA